MAEPLREVAEELVRRRVDLLREEADVVGKRDGRVHHVCGLVETLGARERVAEPKRGGDERTLLPHGLAVPVEERPAGAELSAYGCDRRLEPLRRPLRDAPPVPEQRRRVELVLVGVEAICAERIRPAARFDEALDLVQLTRPLRRVVV